MSTNVRPNTTIEQNGAPPFVLEKIVNIIDDLAVSDVQRKSIYKTVGSMVAGLYGLDGEKLENWAQSIIAKIKSNREANERAKQEQNKPKPQANNISDLGIRAGNYNFFKTVREQKAREDIVMYMISMIVDVPINEKTTKLIDDNFLSFFCDLAGKVIDEKTKQRLALVLLNEIKGPGSITISSLETLVSVHPDVLKNFEKLCQCSYSYGEYAGVLCDPYGDPEQGTFKQLGLTTSVLEELQIIGLLTTELNSVIDKFPINHVFDFAGKMALLEDGSMSDTANIGKVTTMFLTRKGKELRGLIPLSPNRKYLSTLEKWLVNEKNVNIVFTQ
jgi:hypothetical protein